MISRDWPPEKAERVLRNEEAPFFHSFIHKLLRSVTRDIRCVMRVSLSFLSILLGGAPVGPLTFGMLARLAGRPTTTDRPLKTMDGNEEGKR